MGGNAAEKSTIIKLLLGFLAPKKGSMRFDNWDLNSESESARKDIFYLPEHVNFYPELFAVENLEYLCCLSDLKADQKRIQQAHEEVDLNATDHTLHIANLYRGIRQKIALAFAKLKKAPLFLLHEPTSGLDPTATREFVTLIESLKKDGTCTVLVTHDLVCAHMLADEIDMLKNSNIHESFKQNDLSLDELENLYFDSVLK